MGCPKGTVETQQWDTQLNLELWGGIWEQQIPVKKDEIQGTEASHTRNCLPVTVIEHEVQGSSEWEQMWLIRHTGA